jgi:beta-glucanase (GH16 family)
MKIQNLQTSILAVVLFCASPVVHAQQWSLVWSDEFDGNSLDLTSWSYQTGTGTAYGLPAGWGNQEIMYYTNFTQNVSVSDGSLKITAREQSFGGMPYTSARIRTRGLRDFLYGRFEGRIKLPSTSGVWPAFWMLPTDSPYGGWASSGEIDIMESVNEADRIYGTIHHGSPSPNNQYNGNSIVTGIDYSQDFHEYAMEWEPDEIRWYLDGSLYHRVTSDEWFSSLGGGNNRAPFDVPFHMLLNVAVGGNFPGNPDSSAQYPQTLEVDYVRVYEQVQSPFNDEPHPVPGLIEAEDFDQGFNGQSYQDCDSTNNGGSYRDTSVDIQVATESGFNIGWICEDEWMEYTVDVESAGTYQLDVRVASLSTGGSFRLEIDGQPISESVSFDSTGGWQNWQTVSTTIDLEEGVQILRFANRATSAQEYNLNSFELIALSGGCTPADVAEPFGDLNFFDVSSYLSLLSAEDPSADLTDDGAFNFFDISEFLSLYSQGCP